MNDAQANSITPLTVPPEVPVLFVGGSFDPPHRAHIEIPSMVRDRHLQPDSWLVFVPAARSPHKTAAPGASPAQRVEMLKRAVQEVSHAAVWTDELDRSIQNPTKPSFWIDTLRRAARIRPSHPQDRTFIGADQAIAFDRWRESEAIASLAEPIVALRPPLVSKEEVLQSLDAAVWAPRIAETPLRAESSTSIREGDAAPSNLHPAVAEYIESQGLYGQGPTPARQ